LFRLETPSLEVQLAKASAREPTKPHGKFEKGKAISKPKHENNNKNTCYKCGCYNHVAKKCRTPTHLVDLYMKSAGRAQNHQKFEAHFASHKLEMGTSDQVPHGAGPSNAMTSLPAGEEPLNIGDMLVHYSADVYGDLI
jgi:hypothetical protein